MLSVFISSSHNLFIGYFLDVSLVDKRLVKVISVDVLLILNPGNNNDNKMDENTASHGAYDVIKFCLLKSKH